MKRKLTAWLLCAVLVVTGTSAPATAAEIETENVQDSIAVENEIEEAEGLDIPSREERVQAAEGGLNVAYHTQEEIREYIKNFQASKDDPLTFAENPQLKGSYSAGRLSTECMEKALAMMNQIRYIAGISPNVTLSEEYSQKCQAAALLNYLNDDLSHYPTRPAGVSDELWTMGSEGAGSSNLAWASWKNRSLNDSLVDGWMTDDDDGNIDSVGHRRWILNPSMAQTGFGAVSGANGTYSAMYAFDSGNESATETGVAWPAQNMPLEYFDKDYPWSVSLGKYVDEAEVSVRLVRKSDGKTWNFSKGQADGRFYVNNQGYGQSGCVIFRPKMSSADVLGVDSYEVTVLGLSSGQLTYTVNFFSLNPINSIKISTSYQGKRGHIFTQKGSSYYLDAEYLPLDTEENIKVESSNENIVKISRCSENDNKKTIYFKGISPGTAVITVSNSQGTIRDSITVTVIDSLKKVKIRKVRATGSKKLKLTWKAVKNAKGYEVYCSTSKKGRYRRIAKVIGKTQLVHKKRKPGKQYYYKVRAFQMMADGEMVTGHFSKIKFAKTRKKR